MKTLTEQQKAELTKAAQRASTSLTDSNFWDEVQQHLEDSQSKQRAQIEPRKLRAKPNY